MDSFFILLWVWICVETGLYIRQGTTFTTFVVQVTMGDEHWIIWGEKSWSNLYPTNLPPISTPLFQFCWTTKTTCDSGYTKL